MTKETPTSAPAALLAAVLNAGGDPADLPFWQGCEQGLFKIHQCQCCSRNYWPASRCTEHGDRAMVWVNASGSATLHTFTIMHRSFVPAMKHKVPYVIAVVQLQEGPFFHTNIVHCDHDQLRIGMPLRMVFQAHESGLTLPYFEPDQP